MEGGDAMSAKVPIIIYAFHTTDSGGGYDWGFDTPENRALLRGHLVTDLTHQNYETGVLASVTLNNVPENWERVAEFIEWELSDSVETGRVGHIIARYRTEVTA
jgi:hypothetical protein